MSSDPFIPFPFVTDPESEMSLATVARPGAAWAPHTARPALDRLADELRRRGRHHQLDAAVVEPCVDAAAYPFGDGRGHYLVADRPLVPLHTPVDVVVIPADAGPAERAALLGDALAYVAGPHAADAFAAVEALACGTPVIARVGTPAAEVVEPGLTGLVVELDGDAARAATLFAANLDRWACRKVALDRFSIERRALDLVAAAERPDTVAAAA